MTKDSLISFLKEPTLETFSDFLKENLGETNNIDFKSEWIEFEKLAQILIGMGNSGGGCIIIGVAEEDEKLVSKGIQEKTYDPSEIFKKINKYFPDSIVENIQIFNFFYDNDVYGKLKNKKFQMVTIYVEDDKIPIVCECESKLFKRGDIFIRRGTNTEKVNYEELQTLLNRRIEAAKAQLTDEELNVELKQLKILYDAIPSVINKYSYSGLMQSPFALQILGKQENKVYPDESYEQFLVNMIKKKQEKIKTYL